MEGRFFFFLIEKENTCVSDAGTAGENWQRETWQCVALLNRKEESKSGERDDCGLWRIGDGHTSISFSHPTHPIGLFLPMVLPRIKPLPPLVLFFHSRVCTVRLYINIALCQMLGKILTKTKSLAILNIIFFKLFFLQKLESIYLKSNYYYCYIV